MIELLGFLYVQVVTHTGLGLHEVSSHLSAYPAGRQVGDFRSRNKAVHVLVEIDGGAVAVDSHTFLQLNDLAEYIARQPFEGLLRPGGTADNIADCGDNDSNR